MQLVDIGANLGHESFDRDRGQVLARARDTGVAQVVVTGASEAESETALKVARTTPGVLFSTAGCIRTTRASGARRARRPWSGLPRSRRSSSHRGDRP